ncbi:hypothetical protein AVEN_472-1 [Araneus ventricosus]|uniref:Uncharacterized protein n=1 Tax=Araneus ventricosus TaxID=182803 RepID=A0A4Y2UER4_ARAVE|nr:hypothetical protein AVEN_472-1 [Araneus ventricosus]
MHIATIGRFSSYIATIMGVSHPPHCPTIMLHFIITHIATIMTRLSHHRAIYLRIRRFLIRRTVPRSWMFSHPAHFFRTPPVQVKTARCVSPVAAEFLSPIRSARAVHAFTVFSHAA